MTSLQEDSKQLSLTDRQNTSKLKRETGPVKVLEKIDETSLHGNNEKESQHGAQQHVQTDQSQLTSSRENFRSKKTNLNLQRRLKDTPQQSNRYRQEKSYSLQQQTSSSQPQLLPQQQQSVMLTGTTAQQQSS